MAETNMTKPTVASTGKPPRAKSGIKRPNKPRSFYMAYKGQLIGEPKFVFDKDELVDAMLADRELQVTRITVPVGKRRGEGESTAQPGTA